MKIKTVEVPIQEIAAQILRNLNAEARRGDDGFVGMDEKVKVMRRFIDVFGRSPTYHELNLAGLIRG